MKTNFLFLILIFSFLGVHSQETPASADDIMNEALTTARKENKKVFIMFHASWCGWCHKMDASMNDPVCKKSFEDNFVTRHLVVMESKGKENLENPGALEMLNKYHGDNQGIPYWLIFDVNGKLLTDSRMPVETAAGEKLQNSGCPASEEEVDFFIGVLKKTTSIKDIQLEVIKKRFRQNESK